MRIPFVAIHSDCRGRIGRIRDAVANSIAECREPFERGIHAAEPLLGILVETVAVLDRHKHRHGSVVALDDEAFAGRSLIQDFDRGIAGDQAV